ncbi:MAG: hypothetical protein QM757_38780 [Paludibaculum sp.]
MRLALLFLASALLVTAEERINSDVNQKLRKEEAANSQVMKTLHMLTDRDGPRLTGSPNHEAAAKWARDKMTEWGLKNADLEAWEFLLHPGWLM